MGKPRLVVTDHGFDRAAKALKKLAGTRRVVVGIRDGQRRHHSGLTYNELAAIHEFGAPAARVPERSFIRRTFDLNKAKYARRMFVAVGSVLDGKSTIDAELEEIGASQADDVRAAILAGIPPALKAATVAAKRRRGSATPTTALMDTGDLARAIDYEVRRK